MAEKKDKITEILAPCGNMASFKAAVNAGCDACYLAGKSFGARAYADNFSEGELIDIINEAHLKNVRIYLTVNTLLKNSEISELYDYFLPYYENGLDAVIVQDMGVLKFLKREFPDIPIHCSTQMNICTREGAQYVRRLGASRIVTAREMSLKEIKALRSETDIELESFVHGAMCFCYSGRCLMSSLAGGRSGNRGRCAQPCRKPYNGKYMLSMRDMCTLSHVPELVEAGIDSFKIEGRMKNEYYTASCVDAYREMRDDYLNGCFSDEKAKKYMYRLANIYNRGGFSDGYFFMQNGKKMIDEERPNNRGVKVGVVKGTDAGSVIINTSENIFRMDVLEIETDKTDNVEITSNINASAGSRIRLNAPKTRHIKHGAEVYRTRCNKLLTDIRDEIINKEKKSGIECKFMAGPEKDSELILRLRTLGKGISVSLAGAYGMKATQRPTDEQTVYEKLMKIGDTPFYPEKITIDIEDGTFIPMSALNNLKREAVDLLIRKCREEFSRNKEKRPAMYEDCTDETAKGEDPVILSASVQSIKQLEAVVASDDVSEIYLDTVCFENDEFMKAAEMVKKSGKRLIIMSPQVVSERNISCFDTLFDELLFADGIYVRNIDTYACLINRAYLRNTIVREGFTVIIAASLYIMNDEACRHFYSELSQKKVNVIFETSKELNKKELQNLNYPKNVKSETGIYGYEALMVTAQCPVKNENGCGLYKNRITKLTDDMNNIFVVKSNCRMCYNVIYNTVPLRIRDKIDTVRRYRLDFTTEGIGEIKSIIAEYRKILFDDIRITFSGKYTTGHFNRGIE